jgi:glycosyltransferase involved in cell wall biosynthesis
MNQPLVSVIVPCYNVEQYLPKCIDSILYQTYKNLEVWLVDDGSPDKCGAICDEYAKKDARIKVIHKKNGGLADARNVALDVMTGEYVVCVDSDDYISPTHIEGLYHLIEKYSADVSVNTFCSFYEGSSPNPSPKSTKDDML